MSQPPPLPAAAGEPLRLTIDGRETAAPAGATVLAAARALGCDIPTLCDAPGCAPSASCLVCVVRDLRRGRLIPSCAAPVEAGMRIETDTADVREARRVAVELLLSEHVGDCEGPCRRGCPAHVDAPAVLRLIAAGRTDEALQCLRQRIALPGVIGRLCHAPCERVCRRGAADEPLAIRGLERWLAERSGAAGAAALPPARQRAVVVGAGPAGLSAAYHLRRGGCACVVLDAGPTPGGSLRSVPEAELPAAVLAADVAALRHAGVAFELGRRLSAPAELRAAADVVVLAPGARGGAWLRAAAPALAPLPEHSGAALLSDGRGMFACGSAVQPRRRVIQALADGWAAAEEALAFLRRERPGPRRRFDCRLGRLLPGELAEFLQEAEGGAAVRPARPELGYDAAEAAREARRCLRCDCRRRSDCRLREAAERCGASQTAYHGTERARVERRRDHPRIVFEPGKCIRCGLCIQTAAQAGEPLGLAFLGRAYGVRVGPPFNAALAAALTRSAAACVAICPTGALAWREELEQP